MAKFRSIYPELCVLIPAVPRGVRFRDHVLETRDPAVTDQLRRHPGHGSDFHEESDAVRQEILQTVAPTAPAPADPQTAPVADAGGGNAKSKNQRA